MKKLFILTAVIAASLIAVPGYSQVYVNARVGFGHIGIGFDGYAPVSDPIVYENEFPGYAYYNYPVWNGHYRDRAYYEHYRPYFERENIGYFNHGRFENERFEQAHYNRGYADRGYANRGYADRGNTNRGYASHGYASRGYSERGHSERGGNYHGRR